jgi:DHA3 family macrolide efflux protein-like MFS transporter
MLVHWARGFYSKIGGKYMKADSFKTFLFIWSGQFTSVIGSMLTQFALGIWILKETGSITQFSIIFLSITLPTVLISPVAGVIVDRFPRKQIMIISDSVAGLSTLILFLLIITNQLEAWHIYIASAISSIFNSFQTPAYQSTVSLLVPKKQLGRANGMIQLADSTSFIIAPLIAGILLHTNGLPVIMIIDISTFLFALITLLFARFPKIDQKEQITLNIQSFLQDAIEGWRYITDRPGLILLLISSAITNFLLGFYNVLFQPLILSISNEQTLGTVLSITGIGMILGGITMSAWGGPKKRVKGMFGFSVLNGIFIGMAGITESIIFITTCIFMALFVLPISNACGQAVWQNKVHPEVQGRVFALRRMIGRALTPISFILAGPLVDKVFNPTMKHEGILANSNGTLIGIGDGRGIGLLFICIGLLWALSNMLIYFHPRIRQLEIEISDAVGESVLDSHAKLSEKIKSDHDHSSTQEMM